MERVAEARGMQPGGFTAVELRGRGCKLGPMAHVRKDSHAKTVQWWKHLRPYWKRRQQRRERAISAKLIRAIIRENG